MTARTVSRAEPSRSGGHQGGGKEQTDRVRPCDFRKATCGGPTKPRTGGKSLKGGADGCGAHEPVKRVPAKDSCCRACSLPVHVTTPKLSQKHFFALLSLHFPTIIEKSMGSNILSSFCSNLTKNFTPFASLKPHPNLPTSNKKQGYSTIFTLKYKNITFNLPQFRYFDAVTRPFTMISEQLIFKSYLEHKQKLKLIQISISLSLQPKSTYNNKNIKKI